MSVRHRGRGMPGRKKPMEVPVSWLPALPMSERPGEPTTLLTDMDWVPPSVPLPQAWWEPRSRGLPQALLSTAWHWPPTGNAEAQAPGNSSNAQHLSSCMYFPEHIRLSTGCSFCLVSLVIPCLSCWSQLNQHLH